MRTCDRFVNGLAADISKIEHERVSLERTARELLQSKSRAIFAKVERVLGAR